MKKILCLILSVVLVLSLVPSVSALDTTDYAGAKAVSVGETVQTSHTGIGDDWFKFTADEDQYYKITILNQSVELRTNIYFDSWLDSSLFGAFFNGKLYVAIRDSHGLEKAEGTVRCGYEGSVSLLLSAGETYYIGFNSNYSGNFRFSVEKLNDMGGNSEAEATEITATAQIISMVDAKDDEDWFTFETDSDPSFYHFSLENLNSRYSVYLTLYEFVEGAGLRFVKEISAAKTAVRGFNSELKVNTKYYYRVTSSSEGGYVIDVEQYFDAVSSDRENSYQIDRDVKITSSYDGDDDTDLYKFTTADFDAYYHINYKPLTDVYYYVKLIDSAGTELISASRNGSTSFSGNIKLEKNTEYYLSFKGDKKGNYEFSLDTSEDPEGSSKETAVAIETDREYKKQYAGNGDTDCYYFTAPDEDSFICFNYTPTDDVYYYAEIHDLAGEKLIDISRGGSSVYNGSFRAERGEIYYISLKGDKKGEYKFSVNTVKDPAGEKKEAAQEISVNTEIKADLASDSDTDWYKFTVSDFESFRVRILTESGNSKRVSLYSDRDMELLYLSGTADRVKELEAGTYYLKVTGGAGYYTLAVGNCGAKHCWVLKRVVKPATCKEKGTESYYCECCYSQKTETVPMLDTHSFEWVIEKEARPGEAGKKVQKCTVCSARGETMTYTAVLLGDADKNGSITAADARFVLRASVDLEKCESGTELFTVCDVDKNKVITASDARLILRASVNLETLN